MQYSPKLKKVAELLKDICKDNDIAGVFVLHTPGHSEFLMQLEPSYSCVKFDGDNIRIKAKLADYNGDKEAHSLIISNTSNMFKLLSETTTYLANNLTRVSQMVDKAANAEHTGDGGPTSHTQQNN